jgi:hypothetical protein
VRLGPLTLSGCHFVLSAHRNPTITSLAPRWHRCHLFAVILRVWKRGTHAPCALKKRVGTVELGSVHSTWRVTPVERSDRGTETSVEKACRDSNIRFTASSRLSPAPSLHYSIPPPSKSTPTTPPQWPASQSPQRHPRSSKSYSERKIHTRRPTPPSSTRLQYRRHQTLLGLISRSRTPNASSLFAQLHRAKRPICWLRRGKQLVGTLLLEDHEAMLQGRPQVCSSSRQQTRNKRILNARDRADRDRTRAMRYLFRRWLRRGQGMRRR